mmetsp:Transcript_1139/g.3521  ORF Transcript_1139/g.3521 Transcript_1139/m.3521 type:complete len:859 (-) Transcript_1139:50-2626(-)
MAPQDAKKGADLRKGAEACLAVGDFEEALVKAKEAAELLEDAGEEEALALGTLATANLVAGRTKVAKEKARAALALAESLGAGPKAAAMLTLVKTYFGYKLVPASILSPESAMVPLKAQAGAATAGIMASVRDVSAIDSMSPMVDTSILQEDLSEASKVAEDALAFFKEAGDKLGEAMAMYLAVYVKSEKRSLRDMLPPLEEVQKAFQDAGAKKEAELVVKDILSYHITNADTGAAAKVKDSAATGDKKAEAAFLIRVIADTYFTMKEADEAQKLVMEALAAFRAAGDKDGEAGGLRAVVNLNLAKGDVDEALSVADQIVGKVDDQKKKGAAMYIMASVQLRREGGASEAAASLSKAGGLFKAAGAGAEQVEAAVALAEVQLANGEDAALSSAQEALAACKSAGLKEKEIDVLRTIVSINLAQQDDAAAMKIAKEGLNKAKETGSKPAEISSLRSVAEIYLAQGNPTMAIETATEMLALCVDAGKTADEAAAKFVLASAILSTDVGSSEGLREGREALALFEAAGDSFGAAQAMYTLAIACFNRADLEDGLKYAREALAHFRAVGDADNEEILKQTIEDARSMAAEYRKQTPKRPMTLPAGSGPPPSTGPESSPITESVVPKELLEPAVASRKYWGIPKMVQQDPTVDAIERAPSHSIIFGQNLSDNVPTQVCVEFGDLVATMAKGDVAKIPIVVTTCGVNGRMTGEHVPTHMTGVSAVTVWGMVRTVKQEIPQVQCVLLDFSAAQTMAQIPRNLRMPPMVAESAYYHGARWEPQLAQVPSLFRRELKRDNLTGGGGGSNMGDPKKAAKFMRRSFNWTGPSHKLDFAWYRQEWRAVGAAMGDIGPMPPQQPCKAIRSV